MKRGWQVLLALALVWAAALLHRGQPLGWDEIEFFRATKWMGEGRVPFRDFWEHHTPLQWMLFAPVAKLFASGPGAEAIVTMRWAQVAIWIATVALLLQLTEKKEERLWALVLLLSSPIFVRFAVEYRVDVLGNLGFVAAMVAAMRARWIAFGALMAMAVLANMRLAPLVIVTALVMLAWRSDVARWGFNARALRMVAGVAMVAVPFVGWLFATGTWRPFVDAIFTYNIESGQIMDTRGSTLFHQLFAPILLLDPAAIVLWVAAIATCVLAWKGLPRPAPVHILGIVFVASVVNVALMEVQYEYHFQGTYLLMVPLAAFSFQRMAKWQFAAMAVAVVALVVNLIPLLSPAFGNAMRYQDFVMEEVDRRTAPSDRVFDGVGYALRREPAHRYWFLPVGVRFMSAAGKLPPFPMETNPPAAIIFNLRMKLWFDIFPESGRYAVRHYVPLTRDLWVPGMSTILAPGQRYEWVAPEGGRFTLWPGEPLVRHPWLIRPAEFASLRGPQAARFAIPLQRLPRATRVTLAVDGIPMTGRTVDLKKGSRVVIVSGEAQPIGALLVPADLATICLAPEEEFSF
jgi:hypothetical protein